MIMTTKEIIGNFTAKQPKRKTGTLKKLQLQAFQKKSNHSGAQHQHFLIFLQIKFSYLALEH